MTGILDPLSTDEIEKYLLEATRASANIIRKLADQVIELRRENERMGENTNGMCDEIHDLRAENEALKLTVIRLQAAYDMSQRLLEGSGVMDAHPMARRLIERFGTNGAPEVLEAPRICGYCFKGDGDLIPGSFDDWIHEACAIADARLDERMRERAEA